MNRNATCGVKHSSEWKNKPKQHEKFKITPQKNMINLHLGITVNLVVRSFEGGQPAYADCSLQRTVEISKPLAEVTIKFKGTN